MVDMEEEGEIVNAEQQEESKLPQYAEYCYNDVELQIRDRIFWPCCSPLCF